MGNTSARGDAVRGFEHPAAFWAGTFACSVGVLLHLPMYYSARDMGYQMSGTSPDAPMAAGMTLILIGLALVMAVAVTIGVMKPAPSSFITPGVAKGYHLLPADKHAHAAVARLPLSGLGGTVPASRRWSSLGDRTGRRASITAAAYALVSSLAAWLTPHYSWRILWLLGIPTGLLLIALNRWIPESPRFLPSRARVQEAEAITARYDTAATSAPNLEPQAPDEPGAPVPGDAAGRGCIVEAFSRVAGMTELGGVLIPACCWIGAETKGRTPEAIAGQEPVGEPV